VAVFVCAPAGNLCIWVSIFSLTSVTRFLISRVNSLNWEITASLTVSLIAVSSISSRRMATEWMALAARAPIPLIFADGGTL